MTLHYLVGPMSADWAARYWSGPRARGECKAFNAAGDLELKIAPGDSWDAALTQLPADWRPDAVVLDLAYTCIPPCLWSAPVPLVGLAADWNLLWHGYRRDLARCERVLTDAPGVDVMRRSGWGHGRAVNLYGPEPALLKLPLEGHPRDIDVLFIGNLHTAVQRERLAWLARLTRQADRRVVIREGVFGAAYRDLLRRARVVFNRSVRGECNRRAFEAACGGALLFQERGNAEVQEYFQDRRECVLYGDDDLEPLLDHYLAHEEERRAIAAAAHARVQGFGFEALLDEAFARLKQEWPAIQEAMARRPRWEGEPALLARTWQVLSGTGTADPTLTDDLEAAVVSQPQAAGLHNALGLVAGLTDGGGRPTAGQAEKAAHCFRRALECDSRNAMTALNLIEALAALRQDKLAAEGARRALALLDQGGGLGAQALDTGRFPPGFDVFRVQWEQCAWSHAGDPTGEALAKQSLLRWRLHSVLGDLTADLAHFQAAVQARPDLPIAQAALGCAVGRAGRHAEAIAPLRRAVQGNPFDLQAARALGFALEHASDAAGRERLVRERRLLSRAAPQLVPAEDWFADATTPSPRVQTRSLEDFRRRFGVLDTERAVHSFTPPADANVVLTLLRHAQPRRILEIGTAAGHMTANLTEWSPDDAVVFTLGTLIDASALDGAGPQACETPARADFGRFAGCFGKADKVFFVTADSLRYDFRRLGRIDFAFIDGAHDKEHVRSDSQNAYRQLAPGGWLVWHDYASPVLWVEVAATLETIDFTEPIFHVAGTGVAFLQKQGKPALVDPADSVGALDNASFAPLRPQGAPTIVWEGAQASLHSLALVNRELCRRLIDKGCELSLSLREDPPEAGVPRLSLDAVLTERVSRSLSRPVDVHVRHAWPPDFRPPTEGRFVVMQPWEYGSLPKAWAGPIREQADEVWVYSRSLRDCYVQSGVPAERVHIVPLGVDASLFAPGAARLPLRTSRRFKFLFVGGTIHRKGIDLLLEAYARAFTADDDVCLAIKDMGVGSFYRGQTAERLISQMRDRPDAPEVEYLDAPLSAAEMAGLYAACDCLVHPYRGEGFGLPIVEAMAVGLPVIVTGIGAALDFCDDSDAYLLPAHVKYFPDKRVGEWETVDRPWLAEPDLDALTAVLRRVIAQPEEAKAKGEAGRARVLGGFTWDHSAQAVLQRLEELRRLPSRRSRRSRGHATLAPRVIAPTAVASASAPARHMRVSLFMIVRNEEDNLPACLDSVSDLVDEIVVVDTGSTDRTKEIALKYRAQVYDFPWVDDFAAARNESLRHATGDWVFWLDADDRIDEPNRARLKALFASLKDENAAYVVKCLCLPDRATGTATLVDHVRLFRNHPQIRWTYRVHEQILPAVRKAGGEVRWSDVTVNHAGYQDPALRGCKLERDLRLLMLEDADRPDDPFTLFNMGSVYHELGNPDEALPRLRRSLERSHPKDSIVRKLYALVAGCHRQQNQMTEALAVCREGRGVCPDDAELLFLEGLLRREQGDLAGAETCLLQVLESKPGAHFASVDAGLRGYKGRHNLAVVYHQQGRAAEAEAQWRRVVDERPDYLPGWLGLGEAALKQQRWGLLEEARTRLEKLPQGPLEAALLHGRGLLARAEYRAALAALEAAAFRYPDELGPRVVLTHVLLQQGTDLDAAEAALREVLSRVPNLAEARHNLELLLRRKQERQEQAADAVFAGDGPPVAEPLAVGLPTALTDPPVLLLAPTAQEAEPEKTPEGSTEAPASPASSLRLAVVCIVHNEEDLIDAFLDHYLGQGADAVFVVDNDSTDATVERARRRPTVVVEQLESGELDEELRTATFQRMREACAGRFDWVVLVDCDELLAPKESGTIKETLARRGDACVLGTDGWDVVQRTDEPPLDPAAPLPGQRRWGVPNSAYDKPVVLRPGGPERLSPGQHFLLGDEPRPAARPFWLLHFAAGDERLFFKRRRKMTARQGLKNIQKGYSAEHTFQTEADIRCRWRALQENPRLAPLPVGAS